MKAPVAANDPMNLLDQLNDEQRKAADIVRGPVLVIAGAGSGKTRVVTCRMINLLNKGIPPSQILGVTFTNKAAGEMQERVRSLTQHSVLICTFHSLGARILRESISCLGYNRDFVIYDEDDANTILRSCLIDVPTDDKKCSVKVFRSLISKAKNAMRDPSDENLVRSLFTTDQPALKFFPQVYDLYQRKLQESNALDFDDLLFLTVRLLRDHPTVLEQYHQRWSYFLIDEYQDTNAAQYKMVRLLASKYNNVFAVGDPDQSIYSWRGANIHNILNFEEDFEGARVIRLEQNYRSRSTILEAANAVIAKNNNRYDKQLWSTLGPGEKIQHYRAFDERDEARYVIERVLFHHRTNRIPLKDMVVFYRTNAQSRPFEDVLLSRRLSYSIIGGVSFYNRREIKDVLAFLRMVQMGSDVVAFTRTIHIPKRGLGESTVEKIENGASQQGIPVFDYCEALLAGTIAHPDLKLTSRQQTGLNSYVQLIRNLRQIADRGATIAALVQATIEQTGYLDYLNEEKETAQERKENLNALIGKAVEWEEVSPQKQLSLFLEELSLKSSIDEMQEHNDKLNLMTIHHGKGLEFSVTFLVGLEEDLFPHINSKDKPDAIEEERRLFYVGMTRAKEFLYFAEAAKRFIWGQSRKQRPSRFLLEVPRKSVVSRTVEASSPPKERNVSSPRRLDLIKKL